jgi:PAS domain S-box-containing protein
VRLEFQLRCSLAWLDGSEGRCHPGLIEAEIMTFQSIPQAIPIGIATVISGALAVFAWRRRFMPLAPAFAAMMAGESVWSLGAALEPSIVELPIKRLCIDLRLLGTVAAMLGLVAFVFRYTGCFRWLKADRFGPVCAPALTLLLLAWTDPWHHLYWASLDLGRIDHSAIAIRSFGPGFWAMCAFCYALVALSTLLLIQAAFHSTGLYRVQTAVMLFGVLFPWVVEIIDMLRLFRFVPVDLVSMTFTVTGLTFLPALFRFHLLDQPPVAWARVVNRMDDVVVVIDPWLRIVNLNPAAERLTGKTSREVTGVEVSRAFSNWSALADRLGRVERHEESFELDGPDLAPDSSFDVRISPLGEDVRPVGWVLVLRDITELKQADQERVRVLHERAARAEAETANRAKDRFLATLSHELRTPLNPILVTVTAMLDDSATPAEFRAVLEMIHRNVTLEARLIDDLLDLTRIRAGQLHLKREVIDAHELVHQVVEICREDFRSAGLRTVLDLAARRHDVDADPARLQQVLWNLIKNAIKFSATGGDAVTIRSRNREDDHLPVAGSWLVIEVTDPGIGIEPELLPRVFSMFDQGGPSAGPKFGGLGLGLTISRSIVEQHGGHLSVSSEGHGKGATLSVELPAVTAPISRPTLQSPTPDTLISRRCLKILMVEDNKDTLSYFSQLLKQRGHVVRTASSLAMALRMAQETEFELLISDIELPDGSGLELMWKLRSQGAVKGIALSGFGSSDDVDQSRVAGFSEHLIKPVEFRHLEEAIQRVAASTQVEGLVKN